MSNKVENTTPEKMFGDNVKDIYFGDKPGAASLLFRYKGAPGTYFWIPNFGCHGSFNRWRSTEFDQAFSSLRVRYESEFEAAKVYWDYLLSPTESPYRKVLSGLIRVYDEQGRPLAFGITDMDAPSQLAVGLMIQCRIPQENSNKLRSFWHWYKSGFTKAEALVLSERLFLHVDGSLSKINDSYHHGFNVLGQINTDRVEKGNPDLDKFFSGSRLNNYSHYAPVTALWSTGGTNPTDVFKHIEGQATYKGTFDKAFKKINGDLLFKEVQLIDKHDAAKILKEKRNEWRTAAV